MSGFAGASGGVDGYFSGIVKVAGPISSHLDAYAIERLPVGIKSTITLPISAVSLPLPDGASQEHINANSPNSVRLTDGTSFYKATVPTDTQSVKIDNYGVSFIPTKIVSPNIISTKLDSYSIGPLPISIYPNLGKDNNPLIVDIPDYGQDAFNRIRVSTNNLVFSSQLNYDLQPLRWGQQIVGNGSITLRQYESAAELRVGIGATDLARRQTKRYFRYLSGQSLQVSMSFSDAYGQTDVTKRLGYFDGYNGIFLQTVGNTTSIVLRSNITGTPSDTTINQSSWNLDTFNGNGISGITLDLTKANILVIDLQWLGVGRVRVGFFINDRLYFVHRFLNANKNTTVYMSRGGLPCRYEIFNNAGTSSPAFLKQICVGVAHEGGTEEDGILGCADSDFGVVTATSTDRSALTIRLNSGYERVFLRPLSISVTNTTGSASVWFKVILNPTLTGGSLVWANVDDATQQSVTQLTYTAGTGHKIVTGYVSSAKDTSDVPIGSLLGVASNINGTSDILSVILTSSGGAQNCAVSIQYLEEY